MSRIPPAVRYYGSLVFSWDTIWSSVDRTGQVLSAVLILAGAVALVGATVVPTLPTEWSVVVFVAAVALKLLQKNYSNVFKLNDRVSDLAKEVKAHEDAERERHAAEKKNYDEGERRSMRISDLHSDSKHQSHGLDELLLAIRESESRSDVAAMVDAFEASQRKTVMAYWPDRLEEFERDAPITPTGDWRGDLEERLLLRGRRFARWAAEERY